MCLLILPISFFAGFSNLVVGPFKKFSLRPFNVIKLPPVPLISILLMLINSKNDTTLSVEYWILKQKKQVPRLTWEIKGQYKAYNPTLKKCNLCLNEKLVIIDDPDKNLLNKGHTKDISQCRHRNKFKLKLKTYLLTYLLKQV